MRTTWSPLFSVARSAVEIAAMPLEKSAASSARSIAARARSALRTVGFP
ncbi:MAG TPA: hypothetical protein VL400_09185 [Polyangiaceae bacterium]|nr:hypothetical protein [Polyangiaceae bacterium]